NFRTQSLVELTQHFGLELRTCSHHAASGEASMPSRVARVIEGSAGSGKAAPAPQFKAAVAALVGSIGKKVSDPQTLAWMWPKLEDEIITLGGHDPAPPFPGLLEAGIAKQLAHLDRSARQQATDAAFAELWSRAQPKRARTRKGKAATPKRAGRKSVKAK